MRGNDIISELPTRLYSYGKDFNDSSYFGSDDGSVNVQFGKPFNLYGKTVTNAFVRILLLIVNATQIYLS